MHYKNLLRVLIASVFGLTLLINAANAADTKHKPFILSDANASGDISTLITGISNKLSSAGFEIVGKYSPYADTTILILSNNQLRQIASQSEFGAFGANQRVTITKTKSGTQISYTNPTYMAHVYRMKSDLADIKQQLAKVLGAGKEYGPEEGLNKDDLRDYQYKWAMPYFYDRLELADHGSQQKAIDKVEKLLAAKKGGVSKVYRIDLPGKEETVIGVGLAGPENNDCSGDHYIMSRIDFKEIKSSGHLPYEIVISKGKVYSLMAEFRIAINFPDLSMIGSNSFASIMCAPGAIETALTTASGGKSSE